MLVRDLVPAVPAVLETSQSEGDSITSHIGSAAARLTLEHDPFRLVLRDGQGFVRWSTRAATSPNLSRAEFGNRVRNHWQFLHRYAPPPSIASTSHGPVAMLSFDLAHDEHVWGLGEDFGPIDKRGRHRRLTIQEALGNSSPAAYKMVPFLHTSRGVGIFLHTGCTVDLDVGARDATAVSAVVEGIDALDVFLIVGDDPGEILRGYTWLTGEPAVPPPWSFGFWLGRMTYDSQDQVEDVARELRLRDFPCDVLHIDTGWFRDNYVCDYEFDPVRFPDPGGMTRSLSETGIKVSLWQWPNVNVTASTFPEVVSKRLTATRSTGHAFIQPGGYGEDATYLDLSNPDAVSWLQDRVRPLLQSGIATIKADYGEGASPDACYRAVEPSEARNLYPLMYGKALWDVTAEERGSDDTVLWARSGWAGSQRYPVHWSGDGVARFEDLACVLRSTLSMGLSGFPFYAHDLGGFAGVPDPRLYVRWAELAVFCSHLRAHGSPPREPWAFGSEAEESVRELLHLRYRLMPYIWTESLVAAERSLPLVRPLWLDHPHDPIAQGVEDAFMFGRDLLVAPMLDDSGGRSVSLPAGAWIDAWTGETLDGGVRIDVAVPLGRTPVYARPGTVIPVSPRRHHIEKVVPGELGALAFAGVHMREYEVRPDRQEARITVRVVHSDGLSLLELRDQDGAPWAGEVGPVFGSFADLVKTR